MSNADSPATGFYALTKREHYEALALQGLLANPNWTTHSMDDIVNYARTIVDVTLRDNHVETK